MLVERCCCRHSRPAPLVSGISRGASPVFARRTERISRNMHSMHRDALNIDDSSSSKSSKNQREGIASGGSEKKTGVVAYQGVPGAYSEMAANQACPGYDTLPCEQFDVAFESLSQWAADRAVLPVENSLGGSIHAVYDLLNRYKLHIVGETFVAVDHCLLALPGVEMKDIKKVLSHPQALAQTQEYTRQMGVIRQEYDDTAGAAKMIAERQLMDCAAIASMKASELYGLNVLDRGIQDTKGNITRFVVLSREPTMASGSRPSDEYKTSIVFSLNEGPGVLFKALSVFALRDITLTKIESRPLRTSPLVSADFDDEMKGSSGFNYLFYIDFIGSLHDDNGRNALRNLEEFAKFVRVIGSYPRDLDH